MAIDRTVLKVGPARVEYKGEFFFSKGDIEITIETETNPLNTEKWGKLDESIMEPVHTIRFVPVGEWEALSVLFPLSKVALGASVFPEGGDEDLTIVDFAGNQYYWPSAAVTKEPPIRLNAEETLLGQMEFTALREIGTEWNDDQSMIAVTTGETPPTDTAFDLTKVLRQSYVMAWDDDEWDGIQTEDGFLIESTAGFFPIVTDNCGRLDMRLQSYEVAARFVPVGIDGATPVASLFHQGATAARGASLSGKALGNLRLEGDGLYMSMIGAATRKVTSRFGSTVLRSGEVELIGTAANFSSPPFYVADIKEPDAVSGLLMDFDASTGVTSSGGDVVSITDQKSGVIATQGTVSQRPEWVADYHNGERAMSFDGTDDFLQSTGATIAAQPLTLFFVMNLASDCPTAFSFFDSGTPATAMNLGRATLSKLRVDGGTVLETVSDVIPNGAWYLITVKFNSGSSIMRVNGGQFAAGDTGTNSLDDVTLGSSRQGVSGMKGHLLRTLVYEANLSQTDIEKVERYLAARYALPRHINP